MKRILWSLPLVVALAACSPKPEFQPMEVAYELVFTEDFDGEALDDTIWRRIPKGPHPWNRNLSLRDDLVTLRDGVVSIHGIVNDGADPEDKRTVIAGGISTKDGFVMQYGKIEFRMKLENQAGSWPAVWLMPQQPVLGWPHDGEIDIVERLNDDPYVYHTLHRGGSDGKSVMVHGLGAINNGEWNVHSMEWTPDEIVMKINDRVTLRHLRTSDEPREYPWRLANYVMFDMQLEGIWAGPVDLSTMPVAMHLDWVRFYQAYHDGKPLGQVGRFEAK